VNILSLVGRGDIPNPLVAVVDKLFRDEDRAREAQDLMARAREAGRSPADQLIWEREQGLPEDEQDTESDIETSDLPDMIDLMVWACMVAPPVSPDPPAEGQGRKTADGKLSLKAMPEEDKFFVFYWSQQQLDGAARFLEAGAVDPDKSDGGAVRAEAERPAGDPGDAGEPVAPVLP
jgi:hypothetical protein